MDKYNLKLDYQFALAQSMTDGECGCAFIHNNKTVVCNTGKMYDVSNGSIKEIKEPFEFMVGN